MASQSLKLEQAQAFVEDVLQLSSVNEAYFSGSGGAPTAHVGLVDADDYNRVQTLAYKYGLEPAGKDDGVYVFEAGDAGSATRGPARRL